MCLRVPVSRRFTIPSYLIHIGTTGKEASNNTNDLGCVCVSVCLGA